METSEKRRLSPFSEGIGPAIVYIGFRAGAWIAERAPMELSTRFVRVIARVAFRFAKGKRAVVEANLARVVGNGPHLHSVVEQAFESYAEYWLETFRLGRYSASALSAMVDADQETLDSMNGAFAEGKGVILATAHIGFYDLGVAWVGVSGWPFTTVAEVLRPRALFEWFAAIREKRGMKVIASKPGDVARKRLIETVKAGEGVAILAERDLGRRGVWIELFGESTTAPVGPGLLVTETKAPLLVGAAFKEGSRFRVIFRRVAYDPSDDVAAISQLIAHRLESLIRMHPEQWHLFTTNWPSDEKHLPPRGPLGSSSD
ncbi:MAG: phosphatidylinositol mannoside acyltransferase [Actinomycetota bacterium]